MFSTPSINVKQYRGQGFMTVSRYNNTGEYLFVADKDSKAITLINALDYTIIGSYHGHNGVIWCLDTNEDTSILISGSGDTSFIVWDVKTGEPYNKIQERGIPKCVAINKDIVVLSSDQVGKKSKSFVSIYLLDSLINEQVPVPLDAFEESDGKITSLNWLNNDELIISLDSGKVRKYNYKTKQIEKEIHPHSLAIKTIRFSSNKELFVTGSSDCKAKIINSNTFETIHTLKSTHPINCAVFSADNAFVILGGGHEALVAGSFDANDTRTKVYKADTGVLFSQLSNHFGPIRYIDFNPNNQSFVTASQDGIAKIHYWEDNKQTEKESTQVNTPASASASTSTSASGLAITKFGLYSSDSNDTILTNEKINWEDANSKKNSAANSSDISTTNTESNSSFDNKANSFAKTQNKSNLKKKQVYPPGHPNYNQNVETQESKEYKVTSSRNQEVNMPVTIRISNLPSDVDVRDLWETFEFFGRIEERGIKIKSNADDVFAFVNYCDEESAKKAVEKMDRSRMEYSIIHVEIVKPRY